MKGTKLWQAAGSPIIQGRSRRQRPSWQEWLPAWIISISLLVWYVLSHSALSAASWWAMAGGVVGAFLGAVVGVFVARAMGWRFPWIWGAIIGVAGAAALLPLAANLVSA